MRYPHLKKTDVTGIKADAENPLKELHSVNTQGISSRDGIISTPDNFVSPESNDSVFVIEQLKVKKQIGRSVIVKDLHRTAHVQDNSVLNIHHGNTRPGDHRVLIVIFLLCLGFAFVLGGGAVMIVGIFALNFLAGILGLAIFLLGLIPFVGVLGMIIGDRYRPDYSEE
jgi:hypothetical protein